MRNILNLKNNKKAVGPLAALPALLAAPIATLIILVILVALFMIFGGITLVFLTKNFLWLLGGFIIVIGTMFSFKTQEPIKTFLVFLLIGGLLVSAHFIVRQTVLPLVYNENNLPSNVKLAVPHLASYKCDVIEDKVGIKRDIPKEGLLISQKDIGFYTNQITNIQTEVKYGFWSSFIKDVRIRYKVCDINGNNCGSDNIVKYVAPGTRTAPINSVDLSVNSLWVILERTSLFGFSWVPDEGATISYDSKVFGLRLHSTTKDPAGAIICSSSCDLSCPSQDYRERLIYTTENILNFYTTAPYLEYWESIDYNLNLQGGATIYDATTNKFCFGGTVYSSSTIKTDDGTQYIYPDTATRQVKDCCPGAVISTQYEDKICQSDYTWKTITKDTRIKCISDFNCPGQGLYTCQNKIRSGWSCSGNDLNIGRYCVKEEGIPVSCCMNSDCAYIDEICQNNKCVGGSVVPPNQSFLPPGGGGNGKCGVGETLVEEKTLEKRWWNYLGIGAPKETTKTYCKNWLMPLLIFAGLGVIFLITMIILLIPKRQINHKILRR